MMKTEINISKSINFEQRRQVSIGFQDEQAFERGNFLKNLKCKITLEISALKENQSQIGVQQARFIPKS